MERREGWCRVGENGDCVVVNCEIFYEVESIFLAKCYKLIYFVDLCGKVWDVMIQLYNYV